MPQLTIGPYDVAAAVVVRVQLNIDKPGGAIVASIEDERGKSMARAHRSWRTERDLAQIGRVANDLVDHFMWGEPDRLDLRLAVAMRDWCPPVMPALRRHRPA